MKTVRKILSSLVISGLSLSGFCMNLLVPQIAMAMPANVSTVTTAASSQNNDAMTENTMSKTQTSVDCIKMNLNGSLNCCLTPVNHGTDKSIESRLSAEKHHPIKALPVKLETIDNHITFANKHSRHTHHYGGLSNHDLTGETVKRE